MNKLIAIVLLIVAIAAAAPPTPKCLDSCKCNLNNRKLKISKCAKPIVLSNVNAVLGMGDINTIEIAAANITEIKDDAFTELTTLSTISFKNCKIGSIGIAAFDTNLEQLSFLHCDFMEPISSFDSDKLKELIFANCNLNDVPIFGTLADLETLNLAYNNINEVHLEAFEDLDHLETLVLSNNNITNLPSDIFKNNEELSTLYLDNNPLRMFSVAGLNLLEYLSLRSCKLTNFDEKSSLNMNMLAQLDLSGNKLVHLPIEALENMTELTYLDLSNNHLKHLDAKVFKNNRKLEKIVLDENNFTTLPSFVTDDSFATYYFSCKHCGLQTLSDAFKQMPSIISLYLSHNDLEIIDLPFQYTRSLRELDLSDNAIIKINDDAFTKTVNLERIILANNRLMHLDPKIFANSKALKSLDVHNTGLTQLWLNNQTILYSIEELQVHDNKIQTLTVDNLKVTPNLKQIQIDNNPLKCDDKMISTFSYLTSKNIQRIFKTHEEFQEDETEYVQYNRAWKDVLHQLCPNLKVPTTVAPPEFEDKLLTELPKDETDDYYGDQYDEYEYVDNNTLNIIVDDNNKTVNDRTSSDTYQQDLDQYEEVAEDLHISFNLTRASYILSLTAVFILTALVVVIISVSATLFCLRRSSNVNTSNLPHIKIPLWSAKPSQKKHSGSVYQHLSEDYSCPPTPQIHRYDFKTQPTIHTPIN